MSLLGKIRKRLLKPRPIGLQLVAFTLAVAVPFLVFSAYLIARSAAANRADYEQRLRQHAANLADDINRELDGMLIALRTLASASTLEHGDFAEFHRRAKDALAGRERGVILIEPSGRVLLDTRTAFGELLQPSADPDSVKRVHETLRPAVSNLFVEGEARRPSLAIYFPIVRDGSARFILGMVFYPERIRDILLAQRVPASWGSGVSDANRMVVARSQAHERFVNTRLTETLVQGMARLGVFESVNLEGAPILRAVAGTKLAPWMVSATIDQSVVHQAVVDAVRELILLGTALTALAAFSATLWGRSLTRNFAQLANASEQLSVGESIPPMQVHVSEINDVVRALTQAQDARIVHEREMERHRAFLDLIVGAVPSVIYIYDIVHERSLYVSGEMVAGLGYSVQEMEAMPDTLAALLHLDDRAAVMAHHEALANFPPGKSRSIEYRLKHRDGTWRWLISVDKPWRWNSDGRLMEIVGIGIDVTARKREQEELESYVDRLAAAEVVSSSMAYEWDPRDGRLWRSAGFERLTGWDEEDIPRTIDGWLGLVVPEDRARIGGGATGPPTLSGDGYQREYRIRHKRGDVVWIWDRARIMRDGGGEPTRVIGAAADISDRKRLEDRQKMLMLELSHRIKNSFAVLQSVLRATLRHSPDPKSFAESFSGRLHSMAAAQEILTSSNWEGADLEQLAERQLSAHVDPAMRRIVFQGPPVQLPAELAVPLGLVLHELATNAAKHGALAGHNGKVSLRWSLDSGTDGERMLVLEWRETGTSIKEPPTRRGFGSILIESGLPGAQVDRRFEPDGLQCTIRIRMPDASVNRATVV